MALLWKVVGLNPKEPTERLSLSIQQYWYLCQIREKLKAVKGEGLVPSFKCSDESTQ